MTNLWQVTWADVDPAARPAFDRSGITMLVRTLPPAAAIPPAGSDWRLVDVWYDRMTAALVDRLGDWVVGWRYTVAMEDVPDRGVVPVWRAARHAVTTPAKTLARLADAVVAWHDLLVELATDARGRFAAAAPPAAAGDGDPPAWRAVHSRHRVIVHPDPHPRRLPHPSRLSWTDVDPAGRDFDRETVPATVSDLAATHPMPAPGADWRLIDLWLENITVGLVDRYARSLT